VESENPAGEFFPHSVKSVVKNYQSPKEGQGKGKEQTVNSEWVNGYGISLCGLCPLANGLNSAVRRSRLLQ